MIWNSDCQIAFNKIETYVLNPPGLVLLVPGRSLLMYLTVHETYMDCMLGQHDDPGKKEQPIYWLSKKFADYESRLFFGKDLLFFSVGDIEIVPLHAISYNIVNFLNGFIEIPV